MKIKNRLLTKKIENFENVTIERFKKYSSWKFEIYSC